MNLPFSKAAIIDDETDGRYIISHLLKQYFPDIQIIGEAANVAEGTVLIGSMKPDLVFLDVEMPDGTAFDLLSAHDQLSCHVILTTAHDHYAIQAIRASVLDYLLKPVDEEEFIHAVKKALTVQQPKENISSSTLLLDVYKHLVIRKVRIPTLNGFVLVNTDEIVRCEASGNYTIIFFTDQRSITACRKLGEYEEELKGYGFIRIHKKHLVNINQIIEYNKGKSGGGYITLHRRQVLEVSARRKADLINAIG